ncbi:MAG: hypothetical protein ACYC67_23645 [Prosthecobacter sp.]
MKLFAASLNWLWVAGAFLGGVQHLHSQEEADEVKLKAVLKKTEGFYRSVGLGVDEYLVWLRSDVGKVEVKFLTEHYSELSRSNQRRLSEELARTGAESSAPFLSRALSDPEVGEEVIKSVSFTFMPGRNLEPEFCRQLAPAVLPWVVPQKGFPSVKDAMQVLARLSSALAMKHFYNDEFFSPASARVEEALKAFNAADIHLPKEKIDDLLDAWEAKAGTEEETDRRYLYCYVEALHALALVDPERSVKLTDQLQRKRPNEAWLLLYVIEKAHGLEHLVWSLSPALDDPALFAPLPLEAKRYISAVEILAIADEGIEQVFTTSAYNEWDYALQAFEEAGDQEYPKFLRAVAQLFGPGGPPADYAKRKKVIEAMNPSFREQIDVAYKKWAEGQKGKTYVDARYLIAMYAGKHANVLRKLVKPVL